MTTRVAAPRTGARASQLDRFSVLLVSLAAMLWVTDAYFRNQLVPPAGHLSASQIVVMEDALVTLFLLGFLIRGWREARRLSWRAWLAVLIIGVGPQALATVLFTRSFAYHIFAETVVLQQTQPLIAITLAWLVLGERRRRWFWAAVLAAVLGVYLVVFAPDLKAPVVALRSGRVEAGLLALGAAALWASGTVLGRFVLDKLSFPTLTALRFTVALPVLVLLVLVESGLTGFTHYRVSDFVPNLLGIALLPGFLALLLYYRGLASTPASVATIAEMAYPVTLTLIAAAPPPWGFNQRLYPLQLIGTLLLLGVIGLLNWSKQRRPAVVVRDAAA
jgi:drug/metabolite transporter (DMT)-like permease